MRTSSSASSAVTATRDSSGLYVTAFSTRLLTAAYSWPRSPCTNSSGSMAVAISMFLRSASVAECSVASATSSSTLTIAGFLADGVVLQPREAR